MGFRDWFRRSALKTTNEREHPDVRQEPLRLDSETLIVPTLVDLSTPEERRAGRVQDSLDQKSEIRESNMAAGGERRQQQKRGMVRGKSYIEWVEPVEQLKRDGKHDEALVILLECIEAAERDRQGSFPAPWYTWQAAVIYRRQKNYGAEVKVLERWVSFSPKRRPASVGGRASKMLPRLDKARELLAKQMTSDGPVV